MNNIKLLLFFIFLWIFYKKNYSLYNIIIFFFIFLILNNNNYEMLEIQPEIIHKEGQQYYNSFLNIPNFNDEILINYNANTQNLNNNSNKIATTEYVDETFKTISKFNYRKIWSGKINIFYINGGASKIIKLCDFGPENLFSLNSDSNYPKSILLDTTAIATDNLKISISLLGLYNGPNTNAFSKNPFLITNLLKIYNTFSKIPNITDYGGYFDFQQWSQFQKELIIQLYDLKNNNLYNINLFLYNVDNYDNNDGGQYYKNGSTYCIAYFIEQLF